MRTKLIVLSLVLPLGSTLIQNAASAEPYKGTWEQQMACTPDVWRLCGSAIPDVDRIVACLRQNTPNLSDGCRAVFESNNSMDQQAPVAAARPRCACTGHARQAGAAHADHAAAAERRRRLAAAGIVEPGGRPF